MNMIRMVEAFNLFLAVLFTLAYAYQLVYLFLGLIRRKHWKQPEAAQLHRYAAVISARNDPHSKTTELPHRPAGCLCGGGQLHR